MRIRILGLRYAFAPEDVTALEVSGSIPFFRQGIRIRHVSPELPRRIIFWCPGNARKLLGEIHGTGFVSSAQHVDSRVGVPVRLLTVALGILLWNAAFALFAAPSSGGVPTMSTLLPLVLTFAVALSIPRSQSLQALILRPGRHVGEIIPFLRLLALVTGLLLIIFSILIAGSHAV